MIWDEMKRTKVNGVELETYDSGSGEPVVFIHGAMGDECAAVLKEPALADAFHLIHYHRRGWENSARLEAPLSIKQQATDCRVVMQRLGVDRAHVVGQSYGGNIALQMALDLPEAIHSMALLEPGLPSVLDNAPAFLETISEAASLYASGDKADAIETFGQEVVGADYHAAFDETLPAGYFDRWVANVDTLFQCDMPAIEPWTFTREDAARITQPVLNMTGVIRRPISGTPTRQYRSGCRMQRMSSFPMRPMPCSRRTRKERPSAWLTSSHAILCKTVDSRQTTVMRDVTVVEAHKAHAER